MPPAHVDYALTRAHTPVILRRQRRVSQSDGVVLDYAPVVRVELALEARVPIGLGDGHGGVAQGRAGRFQKRGPQILVAKRGVGDSGLGLQPARPPVTARVVADLALGYFQDAVLTPLDALEVFAHPFGAP
jgi:hypothetical protein